MLFALDRTDNTVLPYDLLVLYLQLLTTKVPCIFTHNSLPLTLVTGFSADTFTVLKIPPTMSFFCPFLVNLVPDSDAW